MFRRLPMSVAATIAAAILVSAGPAAAQDGQLLGSRVVADFVETDVLPVPGNQAWRSIRLCVAQRAVQFRDLDIRFANGGHQDAAIRSMVPAGSCTRWIDLAGGARNITQIVMRFDTQGNLGAQGIVSAYAR